MCPRVHIIRVMTGEIRAGLLASAMWIVAGACAAAGMMTAAATCDIIKSKFTLAHFGMFLARDGAQQPGLLRMTEFLRNGGERCHVKLTAPYRMATAPAYADAAAIAHVLIDAAPERIIWGSDYPYLSHADKVNSIDLFNLVAQWMPDALMRRKLLVDNPARLFGFK
jgi:2-pyrone-4,6-dicarboxylate lactonase